MTPRVCLSGLLDWKIFARVERAHRMARAADEVKPAAGQRRNPRIKNVLHPQSLSSSVQQDHHLSLARSASDMVTQWQPFPFLFKV